MRSKLDGQLVCLDLSSSIAYKQKKKIIDSIINNGGRVSFILNKKVKYLIKDERLNLDSYKCRMAFKLGIPVIDLNYINYIESFSPISDFVIKNKFNEDNLNRGVISKSRLSSLNLFQLQFLI